MTKPPRCPQCGAPSKLIIWGMPGPEDFAAADRGEVVIGGCTLETDARGHYTNPMWQCSKGHGHGSIDTRDQPKPKPKKKTKKKTKKK